MAKNSLPPLAFGEPIARLAKDPRDAADRSAATVASLKRYEAKGGETSFRSRVANISLNGLALHANASGPVRAELGPSDGLYFIMTLSGICRTEIAGRKYEVLPNNRALLLSEREARYGESETRSVFVARLDAARLETTAHAMQGRRIDDTDRRDAPVARSLALQRGAVDFAASLRAIFSMIDSHFCQPDVLEALGVDDLFYRQIALLSWPDDFLNGDDARPDGWTPSALDELCETIRARTDRPLTMTEMEKISGLSRRTLQYAFNRRFGCAPMEWQKRERLHVAHKMIMSDDKPVNIAALSAQLGFSSPSRFAAFYRQMFGEAPARARRRLQGH